MVNTFLVDSNFAKSARLLDSKRLGKQRVEALQILHLIQYLTILSNLYSTLDDTPGPIPLYPYNRYDWIRKISKIYNSSASRLLFRNNKWHYIDKDIKMIRMGTNEEIVSQEDSVGSGINSPILDDNKTVKLLDVNTNRIRTVDSERLIRLDEIYISLGFVYHPAVLMWLGHEDALKEYINVHIDEWVSRGFKNTIGKYDLVDKIIVRPAWTYDQYFHQCHRSNLLRKEIENDESSHYQILFNVSPTIIERPYFWPYTPKVGNGISDANKRYRPSIIIASNL
jgi:Pyrimidine dimer DNA glycosylase